MRVKDFEIAVGEAETPKSLGVVFSEYFRDTDVERLVYLHLPPLGAVDSRNAGAGAEGFPEELVNRYIGERLWDNPMLRHAHQDVEPIYWDEIPTKGPVNERERAFLEAFKLANIGDSVGIHVYGPNGRSGQCGQGFRHGVRRLKPAVLKDFQWVCQLAHLRYCAMLVPTLGLLPELSMRETEVLAWVAQGKSNGLIGEILGISSHTVDAHLRRISEARGL